MGRASLGKWDLCPHLFVSDAPAHEGMCPAVSTGVPCGGMTGAGATFSFVC